MLAIPTLSTRHVDIVKNEDYSSLYTFDECLHNDFYYVIILSWLFLLRLNTASHLLDLENSVNT